MQHEGDIELCKWYNVRKQILPVKGGEITIRPFIKRTTTEINK